MKNNRLKQYVALRDALTREKVELESRLQEINEALGIPAEARSSALPQATAGSRTVRPAAGGRKMSAEAKARIAEAQRARWARIKGRNGTQSHPEPASSKNRRVMSASQKAKIAAAQRARWARIRAGKA